MQMPPVMTPRYAPVNVSIVRTILSLRSNALTPPLRVVKEEEKRDALMVPAEPAKWYLKADITLTLFTQFQLADQTTLSVSLDEVEVAHLCSLRSTPNRT